MGPVIAAGPKTHTFQRLFRPAMPFRRIEHQRVGTSQLLDIVIKKSFVDNGRIVHFYDLIANANARFVARSAGYDIENMNCIAKAVKFDAYPFKIPLQFLIGGFHV